jgi:hypothetical protein
MEALVGVPIQEISGLSRLLSAVEESLRVGRTVYCSRCGTVHHTIAFVPGAEFPCSRCRQMLLVPQGTSRIVDIPPFPAFEV